MLSRWFSRIACLAMLLALPFTAHAEATRKQVEELFARSSKAAPSSLAAAREYYESITSEDARSPLADYAFALVLLEQHKPQEAAESLSELLKKSPNARPAQQTLAWVQLVRKDYEEALLGLESLAKYLASVKTITTDHRDTARFLGSALGFLSGPATSPRLEKRVKESRDRILEQLGKSLRPEFDAGFSATMEQFAKLRGDTATAKEEISRIQADAIKAQSEQLDSEKTALTDKQKELDAKAEQRKEEAQAEIDAMNEKVSELQEQYSAVMARGAPLQAQINAAQAEISALTQLVQQDDGSSTIVYRDPDRVRFLERLIAQLQIQLAPMQAELNAINFRVADLRNKYGALLRQNNIDLQKMFGEGQKLARNQTRLERMEKQHAKAKATGSSTKTRTLSAKMTTFSTYEPFPMAREKDRVLRALK